MKFIETAHVKDLMAFLRLAENPRDIVSGSRLLPLLPGIGSGKARQLMDMLLASGGNFAAWSAWRPPSGAAEIWPKFVASVARFDPHDRGFASTVAPRAQVLRAAVGGEIRSRRATDARFGAVGLIALRYRSRQRMLLEMTLDPPSSTQDLAGPPDLDDDYLVLSTIHSAKGLEWDAVYVIQPPMATSPLTWPRKPGRDRRGAAAVLRGPDPGEKLALCLLSATVLLTRPQRLPHVCPRTRFLPDKVLKCFQQCVTDSPIDEKTRSTMLPAARPAAPSAAARKICGGKRVRRPVPRPLFVVFPITAANH